MDHTVIVIGHGQARTLHDAIVAASRLNSTVNKIVAVTPRNDPLKLYDSEYLVGNSDYNGIGTQDRTIFALTLAATMQTDCVTILEYDAIAWPRYFELAGMVCNGHSVACGTIFTNGDRSFRGTYYTHWPVTATPSMWRVIAGAASQLCERGFPDRLVGAAVELAGFEFQCVTGSHFSANKINESNIKDAINAIAKGACCMHGIKSLDILSKLDKEYWKQQ